MSDYGTRVEALTRVRYPDASDDMDMHDITDGIVWMVDRIEQLAATNEQMADRIEELEAQAEGANSIIAAERAEVLALRRKLSKSEALLAKAVRLMELSVELATWNTTLREDVIDFTTELRGQDDE